MRSWITHSAGETLSLGKSLASELEPNGSLLLSGTLGIGKTVLAQGVALGLGIDSREVQSPTFTIVREHGGLHGRLVHIDLYRLEDSELESIGLDEILVEPGVKVIEWGERWPFEIPNSLSLELKLESSSENRLIAETANALVKNKSLDTSS